MNRGVIKTLWKKISNYGRHNINFFQTQVHPRNGDALRFLWSFSENYLLDTYQMYVHLFGKTDSPCCSNWAILTKNQTNKKNFSKNTINTVLNNFYMDDLPRLLWQSKRSLVKFISINQHILKHFSQESLSSILNFVLISKLLSEKLLIILTKYFTQNY